MGSFLSLEKIIVGIENIMIARIAPAALIFLAGYLLQRLFASVLTFGIEKIVAGQKLSKNERDNRLRTLGAILRNGVGVSVIAVALITALSRIGLDIAPLLTGAGIIGLAVGFGAQTLVRDVVTGFFILFENQFNLGDEIEIAGTRGTVKEIKLRTTTLVDKDGTLHVIPNSTIARVSKFLKHRDPIP